MSRLRTAAGALVRFPANRLRAVVIDACLLRIQQSQIGDTSCLMSDTHVREPEFGSGATGREMSST